MLDGNFIDFDSPDSTKIESTSTTHWSQPINERPWEIDFSSQKDSSGPVIVKEKLEAGRVDGLCNRRVELLVREHVENHLTTGQIERQARIRMIDEELDAKMPRVSDEEWGMLANFQETLNALKD